MSQFNPLKIQVDPTRNPADGEAYQSYVRVKDYVNADDVAVIQEVATPDHPVLVLSVRHVVKTAFGGSATIDVGDGSTADLWIAASQITENTAKNVITSTAVNGVYYDAPFQVKVTLGGTRTGGTGTLLVEMIRF